MIDKPHSSTKMSNSGEDQTPDLVLIENNSPQQSILQKSSRCSSPGKDQLSRFTKVQLVSGSHAQNPHLSGRSTFHQSFDLQNQIFLQNQAQLPPQYLNPQMHHRSSSGHQSLRPHNNLHLQGVQQEDNYSPQHGKPQTRNIATTLKRSRPSQHAQQVQHVLPTESSNFNTNQQQQFCRTAKSVFRPKQQDVELKPVIPFEQPPRPMQSRGMSRGSTRSQAHHQQEKNTSQLPSLTVNMLVNTASNTPHPVHSIKKGNLVPANPSQLGSIPQQQKHAEVQQPQPQRITPASQLQCYRIKGTPFKLKVNKALTSPVDMTTRQKQNLNLLFYNFNQGSQPQQYRQIGLQSSHVIEEADMAQEGGDNEDSGAVAQCIMQKTNTCTDRLQSRNGSRRIQGNRRVINYTIASQQQPQPDETEVAHQEAL